MVDFTFVSEPLAASAISPKADEALERAALEAALGFPPPQVVGRLFAEGVRAISATALEWMPAVDICWLDGVDPAERVALQSAVSVHPRVSRDVAPVVERWLETRPSDELLAAGRIALRSRLAALSRSQQAATIRRIMDACEAAARAARAPHDVDPVSTVEREQISRVARYFGV